MTGSPFSNVVGVDPADSSFVPVRTTQVGDSTDADRSVADSDTEPSFGVVVNPDGSTHEAGQDETAGQTDESGTQTPA
jgi:hypothetical protein